jgi:hypothetical protein
MVGLVGEEHLEAVAVVVGEAQLGAGVGVLSSAEHAGTFRPGVQVDPAGQLAHLRAMAELAVGVDCWGPGCLGLGEDRLADVGVDRHAHREPHTLIAQVPGELGAVRVHLHMSFCGRLDMSFQQGRLQPSS